MRVSVEPDSAGRQVYPAAIRDLFVWPGARILIKTRAIIGLIIPFRWLRESVTHDRTGQQEPRNSSPEARLTSSSISQRIVTNHSVQEVSRRCYIFVI